jgi:predicted RNA-binding Zn ribbon-like protein
MDEKPLDPPTIAKVQAAGFPIGGETLAVDLAKSVVMVRPEPRDLLADEVESEGFWVLHAAVLPDGWAVPDLRATRRLRHVVRPLLDAARQGGLLPPQDLFAPNAFSERTWVTLSLAIDPQAAWLLDRWHAHNSVDFTLGAVARSAIELLADPEQRSRLRRCVSPTCTMLFVGGDRRRRFCTPNICGNRERAARRYRRHHGTDTTASEPTEPGRRPTTNP